MPLRVTLVIGDFPPRFGGIATLNHDLVYALAKDPQIGAESVLLFQKEEKGKESPTEKLTIYRSPMRSLPVLFFSLGYTLWRRRKDTDVYHSLNIFPIAFFTILIGKYLLRKPVVVTFFGTDVLAHGGSAFTRRAKRFVLHHADALATISAAVLDMTAKRYGLRTAEIPIIPYTLPPHERTEPVAPVREAYGYGPEDILVLSVGTFVKRKAFDDLIRAVAKVKDARVKLLVVGDGPERSRLEALILELGVSDRVRLAGRVADVDSLFHHTDIFVLASKYLKEEGDIEGLGIVMLEAAQHRVPVIGTNSGGIPEAFVAEETGILVPESDVAALSRAIEKLAHDAALRARFGQAGERFVNEKFNALRVARQYRELYARTLQKYG